MSATSGALARSSTACAGHVLNLTLLYFSYFQRGTVREGLNFLTRTIVQRTQPGQRQSVKTEGYFCHVHVREYGLAAIVVADQVRGPDEEDVRLAWE